VKEGMNGSGSLTLEAGLERTWEGLFNPAILEKCMMGCRKLTKIDQNKYVAEISIGIPPLNGKYESIIEIEEIEKWKTYKLMIKAEGDSGNVEATSLINLIPEDDGKTTLSYTFEAEVSGKALSVGNRIVRGVGKLMIQDFFKKFGKELKKTYSS
jgi:carbon monoxide dehydrogenase subunit G